MQFMSSQPSTPQVARPVPQRAMSKELDLEKDGATATAAPKRDLIKALEAQADEM